MMLIEKLNNYGPPNLLEPKIGISILYRYWLFLPITSSKRNEWPISLGWSLHTAATKWKHVIQRLEEFALDSKQDVQLQLNLTYYRRQDRSIPLITTTPATKPEPTKRKLTSYGEGKISHKELAHHPPRHRHN